MGLAKKRGLVFFRGVGVDTTMHTMMEEIKAMAQEIQKMSILETNTSKKFYHHIKFRVMCSSRKAVLENFLKEYSGQYCVLI